MKVNISFIKFESVLHFAEDLPETLTEPWRAKLQNKTEQMMNVFKQRTSL